MALRNEFVNVKVSDGTEMRAYVSHPEGRPAGAMLVFQEIFGINSHIRDITGRFAKQGYLSVAPELFHRFAPGFECGYSEAEVQVGIQHLGKMTPAGLEADIRAAFDWVQTQGAPPTGAIGYCMGGRCAFLAGLITPLACAVSYYGGGIAPYQFGPGLIDRAAELKAPILLFWGGKDYMIPPEAVQSVTGALRSAKKTFASVEFSWADHGFFCDARPNYDAAASAQAWPLTLAFLESNFAGRAKGTGG
jgi:carboxymethylenebutenolidase